MNIKKRLFSASISRKILIASCLFFGVMLTSFVIHIAMTSEIIFNGYFEKEAAHRAELVQHQILTMRERLRSSVSWFESSQRLCEAVKRGDRNETSSLVEEAFSAFGFDYFIITDSSGRVFYRSTDEGKFGDDLSLQKNIQTAFRGESGVYFEQNSEESFSISATAPLRDGG